jgi:hypothetical protein
MKLVHVSSNTLGSSLKTGMPLGNKGSCLANTWLRTLLPVWQMGGRHPALGYEIASLTGIVALTKAVHNTRQSADLRGACLRSVKSLSDMFIDRIYSTFVEVASRPRPVNGLDSQVLPSSTASGSSLTGLHTKDLRLSSFYMGKDRRL